MCRQKQKIQHSILLHCISTAILKRLHAGSGCILHVNAEKHPQQYRDYFNRAQLMCMSLGGVVSRFEEKDLTQWELE